MSRLYLGLGLAAALWGVVFGLSPLRFWPEMAASTLLLAAFAIYHSKEELRGLFRYRAGMIIAGVAAAAFLYVLFVIGSWASRRLLPFAPNEIAGIYALRELAPPWAVAPLLAVVIAPCEEIFWRGYVQNTIAFRFGDSRGWILMAAVYALVHVWSLNVMLVASALVCGLFWGFLFFRFKSLIPCLISHVLWDLAVFVYYPILK